MSFEDSPSFEPTVEASGSVSSQAEVPAHRSHMPGENLKRTDPFKFGSRHLAEGDDVYEFNAWDHVVPDQSYLDYAKQQYAFHQEHPVSDFDKKRFNAEPEKWWNKFYSHNSANFFKNRKWLQQEFPVLSRVTAKNAGERRLLEVGAGAGNTAFPILSANDNDELTIYAYDFSKKAVELIRANAAYDDNKIRAHVWDVAGDALPPNIESNSIDVVLLIFTFSALSPQQWSNAVRNIWEVTKPGGEVCFRDYGRGDLTQVRFKKGRLLEESFYIRGDGTRVYFFEEDEIRSIWRHGASWQAGTEDEKRPSFEVLDLGLDRRMLVNRERQLKMYRCWLQGRFRKSEDSNSTQTKERPSMDKPL